jgi:hypothetical protein
MTPLDFTGWTGTAWCVPSAFAVVTGVTVAKAHEVAAFATGRALGNLEGMADGEILSMASRFGLQARPLDLEGWSPKPKRLRDFVTSAPAAWLVQPIVLTVCDKRRRITHMVASQYRMVCDNGSRRPVPAAGHSYAAAFVVQGWALSPAAK